MFLSRRVPTDPKISKDGVEHSRREGRNVLQGLFYLSNQHLSLCLIPRVESTFAYFSLSLSHPLCSVLRQYDVVPVPSPREHVSTSSVSV